MDLLDRLLDHDQWGTTTLLDAGSSLADAQLDQVFDIGHRTVRATFDHMVFNIAFWTALMAGQPVPADTWRESHALTVLRERHDRDHAAFASLARRIRDEERLDDTFVDHYSAEMTYGGAIIHVVLHNAEHRSEILHMLVRLGIPDLPEIDHGLWDFRRRGL